MSSEVGGWQDTRDGGRSAHNPATDDAYDALCVAAALDAPPLVQRQTNTLAIASVAAAVLWFAGLGAVLALVFGYRARRQIRNSPDTQTGSSLATVGIVLGWIGIAIVVAGVTLIALHPDKH